MPGNSHDRRRLRRCLLTSTLWTTFAVTGVLASGAHLLHAVPAFADPGPGPGQPFGGDDAGCVPSTTSLRKCSDLALGAYASLESAIDLCHVNLAGTRFAEVSTGQVSSFEEEQCEADALASYGGAADELASSSACAGSSVPTAMTGAATDLETELDARGADLYCDASSGVLLDPSGDDAGNVPADSGALGCTRRVSISLAKLAKNVTRCHRKAAAAGVALRDPPYDEDACEQKARGKYVVGVNRLLAAGTCPPCLDGAALAALCESVISRQNAVGATFYPCPDPVLHPGTPSLDRPTLMALGVRLPVIGDVNRSATVSVRYRPAGDPTWNDALALFRVEPETSPPGPAPAEEFAGTIFDLRPSTEYEIELHAVDADGPVDQVLTIHGTTRAIPSDPASPRVVAVASASALSAALASAAPGDVITVADGIYAGPFVLDTGGTAADPIVIRGATRDGTILDGGGCDCNVLEVYGSNVHVENLTLRNATRALRFQTSGAEADVVRRVHTTNTTLGIAGREPQYDFTICDNLLEGRLVWPHVYTDDGGIHANDDGINVAGDGHVVCHNQISGFGDAMKTEYDGARAVDFYGNEVLSAYDNAVELDGGSGNVRAWRNRFTNTFATISFQPIYGGPAYALRNVVVNVTDEQLKFHGLGASDGPSGVLVYNNTFVRSSDALQVHTSAASRNFEVKNNLFVGPSVTAAGRTVDWTAPIDGGLFDSDGYYPDGEFRFELPPGSHTLYASFAAMQSAGMEAGGVLLAEPIFQSGLAAPSSYTTTMSAADATLDASSNAVDAGEDLPGVTSHFQGTAPDLGALERGCPSPIYGIRAPGIDDSNEPTGCE